MVLGAVFFCGSQYSVRLGFVSDVTMCPGYSQQQQERH